MNEHTTNAPPERILVVDDTTHIQRLLSQMLATQGYEVETASDGPEALAMIQARPPDLILLDIMMPQMDGYEVCQRLKDDPQLRDIPIIFISALDETQDKVKAFSVGGVDYVTKPFQIKEVQARVATHLSLRRLQKEIQAASRALEAQLIEVRARNEELDTLARSIAQDLKSPLTSIIGFADMLEKLFSTLPPEQVQESLRTISANGRKMDRIIDKLLLLAGLRQVEQVDIRPLDMGAIIQATLKRLADVIEASHAEIALPSNWPTALGYRPWVEEVWANYIAGAIESGGRPPRLELGATPDEDGAVRFWVRSQNPTPAPTGSRAQAGAAERGLGLVVVRRIMEKLGRKATVESSDDRGHIYSFTLRGVA